MAETVRSLIQPIPLVLASGWGPCATFVNGHRGSLSSTPCRTCLTLLQEELTALLATMWLMSGSPKDIQNPHRLAKGSSRSTRSQRTAKQHQFCDIANHDRGSGLCWQLLKYGRFSYVLHMATTVLDNPVNTASEKDFENPSMGGEQAIAAVGRKVWEEFQSRLHGMNRPMPLPMVKILYFNFFYLICSCL